MHKSLSGLSAIVLLAYAAPTLVTEASAKAVAGKTAQALRKATAKAPSAPISGSLPVVISSIGSPIHGNPAAPATLTEYISYTCSHCADFTQQSSAPLKANYVATGKIKVEYRNIVRDPFDFAAALLAHCGTPQQFLGNHELLLAHQKSWMDQARNASPAQQNSWMQGDYSARLAAIANDIGLVKLMQQRGITPAQSKICLANKAKQDQLVTMTEEAEPKFGVNATPSFLLDNRKLNDIHDWAGVKAAIDSAKASR